MARRYLVTPIVARRCAGAPGSMEASRGEGRTLGADQLLVVARERCRLDNFADRAFEEGLEVLGGVELRASPARGHSTRRGHVTASAAPPSKRRCAPFRCHAGSLTMKAMKRPTSSGVVTLPDGLGIASRIMRSTLVQSVAIPSRRARSVNRSTTSGVAMTPGLTQFT